MKLLSLAFAGFVLTTSAAAAPTAPQDLWRKNGVECWTTGTGRSAGIACQLVGSKKTAIVNHRFIIVGKGTRVLYLTRAR